MASMEEKKNGMTEPEKLVPNVSDGIDLSNESFSGKTTTENSAVNNKTQKDTNKEKSEQESTDLNSTVESEPSTRNKRIPPRQVISNMGGDLKKRFNLYAANTITNTGMVVGLGLGIVAGAAVAIAFAAVTGGAFGLLPLFAGAIFGGAGGSWCGGFVSRHIALGLGLHPREKVDKVIAVNPEDFR